MKEMLLNAIVATLSRLGVLFGVRILVLDGETSGVLLADQPHVLHPTVPAAEWQNPETLSNYLMIYTVGVMLREAKDNLCLAEAMYQAAAEIGLDEGLTDQIVSDLIGPEWATEEPGAASPDSPPGDILPGVSK